MPLSWKKIAPSSYFLSVSSQTVAVVSVLEHFDSSSQGISRSVFVFAARLDRSLNITALLHSLLYSLKVLPKQLIWLAAAALTQLSLLTRVAISIVGAGS